MPLFCTLQLCCVCVSSNIRVMIPNFFSLHFQKVCEYNSKAWIRLQSSIGIDGKLCNTIRENIKLYFSVLEYCNGEVNISYIGMLLKNIVFYFLVLLLQVKLQFFSFFRSPKFWKLNLGLTNQYCGDNYSCNIPGLYSSKFDTLHRANFRFIDLITSQMNRQKFQNFNIRLHP